MKEVKLVGLCGKKGVGKDTAALDLLDKGWARVSFADELKLLCTEVFRVPFTALNDPELKDRKFDIPLKLDEDSANELMARIDFTIGSHSQANAIIDAMDEKEIWTFRELLQFIGTDVCREILDTDIWLKIGKKKILRWLKDEKNPCSVIVTDVRFDNEAALIKELGGDMVEIKRDIPETGDTHASENIDFTVDWTIWNDKTEDDLNKKLIKELAL